MGFIEDFQARLSGSGQRRPGGDIAGSGILDGLQSMFGGGQAGSAAGKSGGLGDILGPGLLGGLLGAFLPGRGGPLRTGGVTALAAMLWGKYQDRLKPPRAGAEPAPMAGISDRSDAGGPPDPAAVRLIRAMVFAAKSDGRIDSDEQAAINQRLNQLGAGPDRSASPTRP